MACCAHPIVEADNYVYFKAKLSLENGKVYAEPVEPLTVIVINYTGSAGAHDAVATPVKRFLINAYDDPNYREVRADAAQGKTEWIYGRPQSASEFYIQNSRGKR
jgi:hypothetical protein